MLSSPVWWEAQRTTSHEAGTPDSAARRVPYGGAVTVEQIDPAELRRFVGDDAIGRLVEYFQSGRFTGGRFDRLAGGGDRPDVTDMFTSDDIVAVSLLGVRIP